MVMVDVDKMNDVDGTTMEQIMMSHPAAADAS
jgi:hypothetical protein